MAEKKSANNLVTKKRRAGVLVPLFSLYTKNSFGIGDFEDLKLLVDWCAMTGYSILQLLPMNEVGPTFCPYDSISSFALEPMYIRVPPSHSICNRFGASADIPGPKGKGAQLDIVPRVDYSVKKEKEKILWDMFVAKDDIASNHEFKEFVKENAYWLDDFSIYRALKGYHEGAPWYEWNEGYKNRDSYILEEFAKEHKKELDFNKWVQWQAYLQFRDAKKYAESKKILLKGDLPILVSRDSADVWAHPDFFKLDFSAGAPPDMYCAKGQRWGMPTYNWEYIEADEFIYLKEKLRFAENFYDILRIDHVVGLFRIWSIPYNEPAENKGLNGFFDPQDERIWGEQGRKLLSVLQNNTDMILCGEDLGVIPQVCRDSLKEMNIPGNDVQRWVKDWQYRHDFLEPDEYRKLSVSMLSTHDTTNWAAWWENEAGTIDEDLFFRKCDNAGISYQSVKSELFDAKRSKHRRLRWRKDLNSIEKLAKALGRRPEEIGDFINLYENSYQEKERLWKHLKIKGPMREKSDPTIVKAALEITAAAESVFCIELIFDLLFLGDICKDDAYAYRINSPGTVSPDNWSLRIPILLEELLKHKITKEIKKIVVSSGRA